MATLIDSWETGDSVRAAAFSPDVARVVIAASRTVWIHDTYTGQKLVSLRQGDNGGITSFAFSPDGRTLASGSGWATVRLWDTETGKALVEPLEGHTKWVSCVKFSLDGRLVVSGSHDDTVRIWDARTGETVRGPIRTAVRASCLALIPGGGLAVGGMDAWNPFKVYDINSCATLFECVGHKGVVRSTSCSPDGRLLASGSVDCTIRFWDPASGQPVGEPLEGHTSTVLLGGFSTDSRHLASSSYYESMRIWDTETRQMHGEPLPDYKASVEDAAFTPDGNCLVAVSALQNGAVKIWDLRSLGTSTRTFDSRAEIAAQGPETKVTSADTPKQAVSQYNIQVAADVMNQLNLTTEPEAEITSATTPQEIVLRLSLRGCANMTDQLDPATYSERPISSGGFGDIYRGRLKDGTQVAVKTIRIYADSQDQKILKRAAHEIYAWSKCKHPNVQPLLGLAMFQGQIGMVARWESNGSLPQYLERRADVDRCTLSSQIAEGLSYLHASGVIHGDLKGGNVLISQDGVARLVDFGNAKLQEYSLKFTQTSTKEALSSRWAAPELFEGDPCSYATDVYALGMVRLGMYALRMI
ncbi:hypothetical protein FRC12_007316 [Ceratobasidium sp. 428]|nr:hypothetical protein FRC12_007316 [Ceratobasidium sp. 428]